jgi:hypothetical protein
MFYKLTLPVYTNVWYYMTCILPKLFITNIRQNIFQECGGFDDLLIGPKNGFCMFAPVIISEIR